MSSDNASNEDKIATTSSVIHCPSCKQKLRIPNGKGTITITCPSCRTNFPYESSHTELAPKKVSATPHYDLFDSTRRALSELAEVLAASAELIEVSQAAEWAINYVSRPLTVLVTGPFNGGKSTLVNCLLGQSALPTDVVPTSAVPIVVKYGSLRSCRTHFRNGKSTLASDSSFSEISQEDSELGAALRQDVDHLEISLPVEFLKHVRIVDSPGLHSLQGEHSERTFDALAEADAVVWVTSCLQGGSIAEVRDLANIQGRLNTIIVANQVDLLDENDDKAEVLRRIAIRLGRPSSQLLPLSARYALNAIIAGDQHAITATGWQDFRERLLGALLPLRIAQRVAHIQGEVLALIERTTVLLDNAVRELEHRESLLAVRTKSVSEGQEKSKDIKGRLGIWKTIDRKKYTYDQVLHGQGKWFSRPVNDALDKLKVSAIAEDLLATSESTGYEEAHRRLRLEEERVVLVQTGVDLAMRAEQIENWERTQSENEVAIRARRKAFNDTFPIFQYLSFRRRQRLEEDETRINAERASLDASVVLAIGSAQSWIVKARTYSQERTQFVAQVVNSLDQNLQMATQKLTADHALQFDAKEAVGRQLWARIAWIRFNGDLKVQLLKAIVSDAAAAGKIYESIDGFA